MAEHIRQRFGVPVFLLASGFEMTNIPDEYKAIFDGVHILDSALSEKGNFLADLERAYESRKAAVS